MRYRRRAELWTIERTGTRIVHALDGTETVEDLPNETIAATRYDILIKRQVREGFRREVVEVAPIERPVLPPELVVLDARNPGLEAAITESPLEVEPYQMYGDWLEQQGDPRGKLIAMQIAMAERGRDQKLAIMLNAFIAKHRSYFYGEPIRGVVGELGYGFFRTIRVIVQRIITSLDKVIAYPSARFVTALELFADRTGRLDEAIEYLADHAPPTLRHLELGGPFKLDNLAPLAPILPRLVHFGLKNVHGRRLDLRPRALDTIVASPFPHLRSLHLDFDGQHFIGLSPRHQLERMFMRTDLPALTTLHLRSMTWADAIIDALHALPLGAQIETLRVEGLTEHGLGIIANSFPRLMRIEIAGGAHFTDAFARRNIKTGYYDGGGRNPRLDPI